MFNTFLFLLQTVSCDWISEYIVCTFDGTDDAENWKGKATDSLSLSCEHAKPLKLFCPCENRCLRLSSHCQVDLANHFVCCNQSFKTGIKTCLLTSNGLCALKKNVEARKMELCFENLYTVDVCGWCMNNNFLLWKFVCFENLLVYENVCWKRVGGWKMHYAVNISMHWKKC